MSLFSLCACEMISINEAFLTDGFVFGHCLNTIALTSGYDWSKAGFGYR